MSGATPATTRVTDAVRAAFDFHSTDRSLSADRGRLLLAVSGGIDSMVLLDAAARVGSIDRLSVATFDHGTGDFARSAIGFVQREARARGIRCVAGRASVALSSEAELRAARWAFLRSVAGDAHARIVTAHTASDQVETVLMRVLRGAGARGLAGLFAVSEIVRPLLSFTRANVTEYAQSLGVAWVDDPSNDSPRYLRNRVRHQLLPALRRVAPSIDHELLDIARAAATWRGEVESVVDDEIFVRRLAGRRGLDVDASAFAKLSADGAAILWPAILAKHGLILDRRGIARLAAFSIGPRVGARIQLRGGWQVVRSRDALQLRASDGVSSAAGATLTPLALSNSTTWGGDAADSGDGDWSFRAIEVASPEAARVGTDLWSAWLPANRTLAIRSWRAGDTMVPASGKSPRKIKQILSEAGVTGHQRKRWPVVLADDQIVWVPGVRHTHANGAQSPKSGLPFICDYFDR